MILERDLRLPAEGLSDEQLKQFSRQRLLELAKQNRAPSVAKAAAAEPCAVTVPPLSCFVAISPRQALLDDPWRQGR